MCRNIERLRQPDRAPSRTAFDTAVADAGRRLVHGLRPGGRGAPAA